MLDTTVLLAFALHGCSGHRPEFQNNLCRPEHSFKEAEEVTTTTKRKRSRQIGRDGHEGFYIKQGLSGLARSNETEG